MNQFSYLKDIPDNIDIDQIIERLTMVKGLIFSNNFLHTLNTLGSKTAFYVSLKEKEIKGIILSVKKILMEQDILLELEAPVKICGGLLLLVILFI
jgi:hypothetical protein